MHEHLASGGENHSAAPRLSAWSLENESCPTPHDVVHELCYRLLPVQQAFPPPSPQSTRRARTGRARCPKVALSTALGPRASRRSADDRRRCWRPRRRTSCAVWRRARRLRASRRALNRGLFVLRGEMLPPSLSGWLPSSPLRRPPRERPPIWRVARFTSAIIGGDPLLSAAERAPCACSSPSSSSESAFLPDHRDACRRRAPSEPGATTRGSEPTRDAEAAADDEAGSSTPPPPLPLGVCSRFRRCRLFALSRALAAHALASHLSLAALLVVSRPPLAAVVAHLLHAR